MSGARWYVSFAVAWNHCYLCLVGDGHKDRDQPKNNTAKIDKPGVEPIVVPIVLRMSDFDHKVCSLLIQNTFGFYYLWNTSYIDARGLRTAYLNAYRSMLLTLANWQGKSPSLWFLMTGSSMKYLAVHIFWTKVTDSWTTFIMHRLYTLITCIIDV